MTYIIYGAPGSGSGIVEAVCAEIGVAFEARDLDARNEEHRGENYAAVNPHCKMPTLEFPDGERLTEILAIVVALDELHREAGILPAPGTLARRRALRWMAYMAAELYPLVEISDYPGRFVEESATAMLRDRVEGLWRRRWQILEQQVQGPWLLGSTFCATDLYLAHLSRWVLPVEWRQAHLPRVVSLADAAAARPALAGVYSRHFRPGSAPDST